VLRHQYGRTGMTREQAERGWIRFPLVHPLRLVAEG
jgi:hypothetical protein